MKLNKANHLYNKITYILQGYPIYIFGLQKFHPLPPFITFTKLSTKGYGAGVLILKMSSQVCQCFLWNIKVLYCPEDMCVQISVPLYFLIVNFCGKSFPPNLFIEVCTIKNTMHVRDKNSEKVENQLGFQYLFLFGSRLLYFDQFCCKKD